MTVTADEMRGDKSLHCRPLATVSDQTPNRLRYDGKMDLLVRRLPCSIRDSRERKYISHGQDVIEADCNDLENHLISGNLLMKDEQLESKLMLGEFA